MLPLWVLFSKSWVMSCSAQILTLYDSLSVIDTEAVVRYVVGLQQSDGSFIGNKWGKCVCWYMYMYIHVCYQGWCHCVRGEAKMLKTMVSVSWFHQLCGVIVPGSISTNNYEVILFDNTHNRRGWYKILILQFGHLSTAGRYHTCQPLLSLLSVS